MTHPFFFNKHFLAHSFAWMALLLVFLAESSKAQTYYFDQYSVVDGLAQSKVFDITQSKDGFIWVGTASGISKFDGVNFENYSSESGLAENGVKTVFEDSKGNIWLGHLEGGVTRYDGENFNRLSFDSLALEVDITSIAEDTEGAIWLTTYGQGAIKLKNPSVTVAKQSDYVQYKGKEGLSDLIFTTTKTADGKLYFITNVGVKYFDSNRQTYEFLEIVGLPKYFQITSMFEDSGLNLWFGTYNGGLYRYDSKKQKFSDYDIKDGLAGNFVTAINEDIYGNIWVGTWQEGWDIGGVTKIELDGSLKSFNPENGLKGNEIRCIVNDREGNVIIGTNQNGFSIYKGNQFEAYMEENGLANHQVWSILEDEKGRFWFGTEGGITVFDPAQVLPEKRMVNFTTENSLGSNQVKFLKKDRNGDIWIGFDKYGVARFDMKSGNFIPNYNLNQYISNQIVTALEIDPYNNLWVGTVDGLLHYNINRDEVRRLTQSIGFSEGQQEEFLIGNEISCLHSDAKGTVWVGSQGRGLTAIHMDEDSSSTIVPSEFSFTPTSIATDRQGFLWIGTVAQGVLVFNGDSIIKQFKTSDGLLADYVSLVLPDRNDNIWIGTNKGLNKLLKEEQKIFTYTEKLGFTGIEVKQSAGFVDSQGDLWFGTVKGAIKNNIKNERERSSEPLISITRFRVNSEDRKMKQKLDFNHEERHIIFDFQCISLTDPTSITYQVMLEGADQDWLPPTKQTTQSYSNLQPNEYTFKVRARSSTGSWNEAPATVSFTIHPPWWQTIWAYACYVLLIAGGFYAYTHIRERNLLREKRILEEKVALRTNELVVKSEELAMRNKDITDSIHYAKRIQNALLPQEEILSESLSEYFILFKPKDIVSGDFYWAYEKNGKMLFSAVDCTGHGVPGAFMSIIGHKQLDKIVGEDDFTQPGEILDRLNEGIAATFRQRNESSVKDGMDLALISYDKKKKELEYAGAINPLYLVRDGELQITKGNRFSIGSLSNGETQKFENHKLKLKKGDTLYIFSDGYSDQFGGPNGKKFKYGRFKEMLLSMSTLSLADQKKELDKTIESWRGELEQVDDILVIGARF